MACVWSTNAPTPLDMERVGQRRGHSEDYILCPTSDYVHLELHPGGLGHPRVGTFTSTAPARCDSGGFVLCDVDISNTYFLKLG